MTYDEFTKWNNRPRFVSPGVFTRERDISVIPAHANQISELGREMAKVIDKIIVDKLINLASK